MPWYIISDNSTAVDAGTVTLLAADTGFGLSKFDSTDPYSNDYSSSDVKAYLDKIIAGTAGDGKPDFSNVAGAIKDTDNGKLYLLSTAEAGTLSSEVLKADFTGESTVFNEWWLCSQGFFGSSAAYVHGESGAVNDNGCDLDTTLGVRPALKLDLSSVIFLSETNTFTVPHSVTITPGSNMTKTTDSGAATQTGVTGAMTDVVYTADEGYKFPETSEAYTTTNGITVARTSDTVITVSGTPTADVEITIPDADIDTMSGDAYAAYNVTTDDNKTKSGVALTALQVTFHGMPWYIISDNSTAVDAGTVTLLAADTGFGLSKFDSTNPYSNDYSSSDVKAYLDKIIAGTAGDGKSDFSNVAGAIKDTDNGKLYLLSTAEARTLSGDVRKAVFTGGDADHNEWWLRSPGGNDMRAACVYGDNGVVLTEGDHVLEEFGVRPALKLNLSSVTFLSETNTFTVPHSVTITPGNNMTKTTDSGAATQTGVTGAMTDVVYTADEGYKFPETSETYTTTNGITVARTSDTVITVSGTPTADVEITIPDADIDTMSGDAYAAYNVTTEDNRTKSGDALTALQVTFHGMPWYIISDNSTAVDAGTVTLLAADTGFGLSKFDSTDPYSN
ncbi:MAG: hypothetical protein J6O73_16185, partial [Lachnospiraceae bacterium]|nr:hypothetical protein [Lachnospiraceae bacterium]